MRKLGLIAGHEYQRHVRRRGFLVALLALPTLMTLVIGGIIIYTLRQARHPVGVVDASGITLDPERYTATGRSVPFVRLTSEAQARAELADGTIQAYVILTQDYPETGRASLYYRDSVYEGVENDVRDYLRASWLARAGVSAAVAGRFSGPAYDLRFISLRPGGPGDMLTAFLIPYVAGFVLYVGIFTTAGYLLQAVVDEKENRTMELLITAVSPGQLMTGKILGLIAVGLTQIGAWLAFALLAYAVARRQIPSLPNLSLSASTVGLMVAWFLPYYLAVASFIAAVGISVTRVSEGQQAISILNLLSLAPLVLLALIIENPDSPLALGLSLFPLTAPYAMLMRWQVTAVPAWQLALSWALLAGLASLALWLVSRLLHVGLLRYGKRLRLAEVRAALRPRRPVAASKKSP